MASTCWSSPLRPSSIAAEWKLAGAQLGILLSAGLLGMSIGSLLLAPFGDRFGRRPIILTCLSLMSIGMLLSAGAPNIGTLAALRVVTGIGIGGMLAAMNVITAEYASDRCAQYRHERAGHRISDRCNDRGSDRGVADRVVRVARGLRLRGCDIVAHDSDRHSRATRVDGLPDQQAATRRAREAQCSAPPHGAP